MHNLLCDWCICTEPCSSYECDSTHHLNPYDRINNNNNIGMGTSEGELGVGGVFRKNFQI